MAYNPRFNRDAKGKYNPSLGIISVKSGTDAYLLEDEVNELQWLQNETRANLIRQITDSGCLQVKPFEDTNPGGLSELGTVKLNSFFLREFNTVLNGYLAFIKNPSDNGNVIQLPVPPTSGQRYDFVYLEFWFAELSSSSQFYQYGGKNNSSLSFEIIDTRINVETSRRIQLQWAIRTATDVNPTTYPLGFVSNAEIPVSNANIKAQGGNFAPQSGYNFSKSVNDPFLFIAGTGSTTDKANLMTSDGYSYAIPLFSVERLNSGGWSVSNLNGGTNYVNASSVNSRSDGKWSNVVYSTQVSDLRHLAALGPEQYDILYTKASDFKLLYDEVYDTLIPDLATKATKTYVDTQDGALSARITTLDNYVNNTLTPKVTTLETRIIALETNFQSLSQTMSVTVNKLDNVDSRLKSVENKLISVGLDPAQNDVLNYGVAFHTTSMVTTGGTADPITDIVSSPGVAIAVNATSHTQYTCNTTFTAVTSGKIGDMWIEKADTAFVVKNTGSGGLSARVIDFMIDNDIIFSGAGTLSGETGFNVGRPLLDTDFVSVTPLEDFYGENGDIYIEKGTGTFTIKNTGSVGNDFEWLLIDTTKLRNIEIGDLTLDGSGTVTKTGTYGSVFEVLIGCPIAPFSNVGDVGEIHTIKSFNAFVCNYTGTSTGKVRYLVFKEVVE